MQAFALFEDRLAAAGETAAWLFEQPVALHVAKDEASLHSLLDKMAVFDGWQVIALSYEAGGAWEPKTRQTSPQDVHQDAPLLRVWQFRSCTTLSHDEADAHIQARLATLPEALSAAGVGGIQPAISEADYCQSIEKILSYIRAGDCYQVNMTYPLHVTTWGHPFALYAALRQSQPVRYGGFVLDVDGGAIVSLSPELFVEKTGKRLRVRPMKGTAPRHTDRDALLASEKNRAENLMIVDLLRNDLGRLAKPGQVQVTSLFEVEAYPTLWQMVSEIQAEVGEACTFSQLLAALFPCGSITGAPKIRATQIAAECEQPLKRGLYTGSLGWLAPDPVRSPVSNALGDCRLNVAIRTLEIDSHGRGKMGVGSGIVADSIPEAEWQECLLKSRFLEAANDPLCLIETLRRENGIYPLLPWHLKRLAASAAWLGFEVDLEAITPTLQSIVSEGGLERVRLTIGRNGHLTTSVTPFVAWGSQVAKLGWADQPIDSHHPLQRHKTTWRQHYDTALATIADRADYWDVLFLNEKGEVAEGARSTVFLRQNGILLTPPLASGALPGVLRAQLLAAGEAIEHTLYPEDLQHGELWMGNAVRGLIRCNLDWHDRQS